MPDGWRGEVVDVSATGMRVRSVVVLAPNSELEGALVLEDGRQIPVAAVVVWTAPAELAGAGLSEFGLELVRPSEQYLAAIAQLFADAG